MDGVSLSTFAADLRAGRRTSEATVRAYLDRIARLDGKLRSFQHIAAESAIEAAREVDARLAAGEDLGPLMGVPIAIKDIFDVEGMPTTAGSRLDIGDLLEGEGPVVKRLRELGCVILGKTRTVEFAFGPAGVNTVRGTPVNPWDCQVPRLPGGSSSGSAVAVAAGLCAFALGSDTGGSTRVPAALCGIFGFKTTVGFWPTSGAVPLAPTLDSVGLLSRSAGDAAVIVAAVNGREPVAPAAAPEIVLGCFRDYFFSELDDDVAAATEAALALMEESGVTVIERAVSNLEERASFNSVLLTGELLATLGRDRYMAGRHLMDPTVAARLEPGLGLSAYDYIRMLRRHEAMKEMASAEMEGLDGWLAPTVPIVAAPIAQTDDIEAAKKLAVSLTRNAGPMNMFGQCGFSLPVQRPGARLPVGLQISCRPFEEERALALALALEQIVGPPHFADVSVFLDHSRPQPRQDKAMAAGQAIFEQGKSDA